MMTHLPTPAQRWECLVAGFFLVATFATACGSAATPPPDVPDSIPASPTTTVADSPTAPSVDSAFSSPIATPESSPSPIPAVTDSTFSSPINAEGTLEYDLDVHRATTAAQSFPYAQEAAKVWRQDAEWYGVVPYTSMERTFALPLDDNNPSWFFRFGGPEKTEFIVEVVNGQVIGVNEIILPDYIEPPLAEIEPLGDEWAVVDSIAVLEKYIEEEDSFLAEFPDMYLDYRLARPIGRLSSVWTLYDARDLTKPILVMDAVTGERLVIE
jgi:hypothetical protein